MHLRYITTLCYQKLKIDTLISLYTSSHCTASDVLYCIVFVNLYSAAHRSDHSIALPVREPLEKKVLRRERAVGKDPERMITRREEGGHSIGRMPRAASFK